MSSKGYYKYFVEQTGREPVSSMTESLMELRIYVEYLAGSCLWNQGLFMHIHSGKLKITSSEGDKGKSVGEEFCKWEGRRIPYS